MGTQAASRVFLNRHKVSKVPQPEAPAYLVAEGPVPLSPDDGAGAAYSWNFCAVRLVFLDEIVISRTGGAYLSRSVNGEREETPVLLVEDAA